MSTQLLSSKVVFTKKPHRCFSCLRVFPSNTKMNYSAGLYEGDFCAGYSCLTCVDIMNAYEAEDGYPEGYVFEMLNKGQTPEMLWDEMNKN